VLDIGSSGAFLLLRCTFWEHRNNWSKPLEVYYLVLSGWYRGFPEARPGP